MSAVSPRKSSRSHLDVPLRRTTGTSQGGRPSRARTAPDRRLLRRLRTGLCLVPFGRLTARHGALTGKACIRCPAARESGACGTAGSCTSRTHNCGSIAADFRALVQSVVITPREGGLDVQVNGRLTQLVGGDAFPQAVQCGSSVVAEERSGRGSRHRNIIELGTWREAMFRAVQAFYDATGR